MRVRAVLALVLITSLMGMVSAQQFMAHYPSIVVYSNGYVQVKEVVNVSNSSVVSITLLGRHADGVSVTSSNGTPVPFEIENCTIVAFPPKNVELLNVSYYTPDLTVKNGIIWTLSVNLSTPFWVVLPSNAVIVDLSSIPLQIHKNVILMPKGSQNVSYILQYNTSTSTSSSTSIVTSTKTSTSSTSITNSTGQWSSTTTTRATSSSVKTRSNHASSSHSSSSSYSIPPSTSPKKTTGNKTTSIIIGVVCAAVGIGLISVALSKRRKKRPSRDEFIELINDPELDLNEDEKKALLYVYDRGGRATQAEIRESLELPKTTAWRMFRRLEEKGLIRIIKKKKGNVVELTWKPKG